MLTVVLRYFFPLSPNLWLIQMWNLFEPDQNMNCSTMESTKTIFNAHAGNSSQMPTAQKHRQKAKTLLFSQLIKSFFHPFCVFMLEYSHTPVVVNLCAVQIFWTSTHRERQSAKTHYKVLHRKNILPVLFYSSMCYSVHEAAF